MTQLSSREALWPLKNIREDGEGQESPESRVPTNFLWVAVLGNFVCRYSLQRATPG